MPQKYFILFLIYDKMQAPTKVNSENLNQIHELVIPFPTQEFTKVAVKGRI